MSKGSPWVGELFISSQALCDFPDSAKLISPYREAAANNNFPKKMSKEITGFDLNVGKRRNTNPWQH